MHRRARHNHVSLNCSDIRRWMALHVWNTASYWFSYWCRLSIYTCLLSLLHIHTFHSTGEKKHIFCKITKDKRRLTSSSWLGSSSPAACQSMAGSRRSRLSRQQQLVEVVTGIRRVLLRSVSALLPMHNKQQTIKILNKTLNSLALLCKQASKQC
jgi:hypothetical protein